LITRFPLFGSQKMTSFSCFYELHIIQRRCTEYLLANLAETYWTQGRLREAEELEMQVMKISKSVLGEEHRDTLRSIANLQWYQDARYKKSETISRSWIANMWRRGKERLHRE